MSLLSKSKKARYSQYCSNNNKNKQNTGGFGRPTFLKGEKIMIAANLAKSYIHILNEVANERMSVSQDARNTYATPNKVTELVKESVIHNSIMNDASKSFDYHRQNHLIPRIEYKTEVLLRYLKIKEAWMQEKNKAEGRTARTPNGFYNSTVVQVAAPVDFSDFYLVDQACTFVHKVAYHQDNYDVEYEGSINLSVKACEYLLENIIVDQVHADFAQGADMSVSRGYYAFKEGTNLSQFIRENLDNTDGIYPYTDDDDDDQDFEDDE